MDYISSTIKGNTHPTTLAILSNSQMDTQIDFVYSEQISTLNSFTRSKASKQVQIVDPLGEKAREGPQSTIKPLPSPIAQVIAATRARQRQRLRPSPGPLPLRETVCVKLGACEVNYSASKTSVCQPKQAFNDGLTNDGVCFPPHRQPRRLAASDLIKVDKMQSQGVTEGRTLRNQSSGQVIKRAVRRLELESLISVTSAQGIEDIDTVYKLKNDAPHIPGSHHQSICLAKDISCDAYMPSHSQPQIHLEAVSHIGAQRIQSDTFTTNPTSNTTTLQGAVGTYLPFKLQHNLLAIAQTLMEESCFYFAHKWAPDVLTTRGWDTPERGELTAWWSVLKACKIPPNAIDFKGTGPATIFQNVRKIRNNAVHRSIVSIPIIKMMIIDALLLISGLKDVPRIAKLRQIQRFLESGDLDALRRTINEPLEKFGSVSDAHSRNDEARELQTQPVKPSERSIGDKAQSLSKSTLFSPHGNLNGLGQEKKQTNMAKAALDAMNTIQRGQIANSQSYALPVQFILQANGSVMGPKALKDRPVIIDLTEDIVIDLTQDSDDENTALLTRPAAANAEAKQIPVSLLIPERIGEPADRRAKKERIRKRRQIKKCSQPLGAGEKN